VFEEFMKSFDSRFIALGPLDTVESFQQDFVRVRMCIYKYLIYSHDFILACIT
jgi:hypothetical protein